MSVKRDLGLDLLNNIVTDDELARASDPDVRCAVAFLHMCSAVIERLYYLAVRRKDDHINAEIFLGLAAIVATDDVPFVHVVVLHFCPRVWDTMAVHRDARARIACEAARLWMWDVLRLVYAPYMLSECALLHALSKCVFTSYSMLRDILAFMKPPRVDRIGQYRISMNTAMPQFIEAMSPYITEFPIVVTGDLAMLMAHARHGVVKRCVGATPLISYRLRECYNAPQWMVRTASHGPALVVLRWRPSLHRLVGLDTRPATAALLACHRPTHATALRLAEALVDARRPVPLPADPVHT
jgi:hypothetical protein